jgi:outer membrane protein assembly factor BamA
MAGVRSNAAGLACAPRVLGLAVLVGALCLASTPVLAGESDSEEVDTAKDILEVTSSGRDFVFMPIPIANPTVGAGLGLAGMFLYQLAPDASPSTTTIAGFYTSSKTWGTGVLQETYFAGNRHRLSGLLGYFSLNYDFYGVGQEPGEADRYLPLNQSGLFFVPEYHLRVSEHAYLGVLYRLARIESEIRIDETDPPGWWDRPNPTWETQSSGLGFIVEYDSRDNHLNPQGGHFLDTSITFNAEWLGSDKRYQIYEGSYNYYWGRKSGHVVAYRLHTRVAKGDVPIFDLSYYGERSDLRGYSAGTYQDNFLLCTQLEYRWRFHRKWGVVAFAGTGGVAPSISDMDWGNGLPSAGLGIRYMASEDYATNVGIDYAVGIDGGVFYFRIGEAF